MNSLQKPLLDVLQGKTAKQKPIWLMRQAGRYLPEYRLLRKKAKSFLNLCHQPDLCVQASLQPIKRFSFDGVIVFSDILLVLQALGRDLTYQENQGPVLTPLKWDEELPSEANEKIFSSVQESLKILKREISQEKTLQRKTLIGFSGAPWTLACYALEGRGRPLFPRALQVAKEEPEKLSKLIDTLSNAVFRHLFIQAQAGAEVVQIFDSWAGILPKAQGKLWCVEPVKKIVARLQEHFPHLQIILFPKGAQSLYPAYETIPNVALSLGSDESMLAWREKFSQDRVLQGNLSPEVLLAGGETLKKEAVRIHQEGGCRRHIFNLGHGVLPKTPVAHIERLIEIVRS